MVAFRETSFYTVRPVLRRFKKFRQRSVSSRVTNLTLQRKPICSFTAFRQIAKHSATGYLPGNGTWRRNTTGHLYRFDPSICHLEYGLKIPSKKVAACLRKENFRHIALMGDSNGRKYYRALHERLSQLPGFNCTEISAHYCVNWTTYEQDLFIYHRCRCGSTGSGRCAVLL